MASLTEVLLDYKGQSYGSCVGLKMPVLRKLCWTINASLTEVELRKLCWTINASLTEVVLDYKGQSYGSCVGL